MKTDRKRNILNMGYLLLLIGMTSYGFSFDFGLSVEATRFIFLVPFAALCAIICDWYYFHISDTYKGIALLIFFGVFVSVISLVIQMNISDVSAEELMISMSGEWAGTRKWNLERMFQFGVAASFIGLIGVPRLLLIELFESEGERNEKTSNKTRNEMDGSVEPPIR